MRNLNTEKCNAVYELMRIMSGTETERYLIDVDEVYHSCKIKVIKKI